MYTGYQLQWIGGDSALAPPSDPPPNIVVPPIINAPSREASPSPLPAGGESNISSDLVDKVSEHLGKEFEKQSADLISRVSERINNIETDFSGLRSSLTALSGCLPPRFKVCGICGGR